MYSLPIKDDGSATVNHHIWIADRSYSLQWGIKQIFQDIMDHMGNIPENDLFSFGWFSSKGEYDFLIKGAVITKSTLQVYKQKIQHYNRCVGATCFSEILGETRHVIAQNKKDVDSTILVFFTDGHPVVNDLYKEERDTISFLIDMANSLDTALFVGYGSYYNRKLMAEMAIAADGTLVHADDFNELYNARQQTIEASSFVEIDRPQDTVTAFYIVGDGVYPAKKTWNKIKVPTSADKVHIVKQHDDFDHDDLAGQYGYALLLAQSPADKVKALDVLGTIGDVHLIDLLSNAFTNEDYAKFERAIRDAIVDKSNARFKRGKDINYLPANDAFCFLDMMEALQKDSEAHVYPRQIKYKRTGAKTEVMDGYTKFNYADDNAWPIDLVWSSNRANLSIRGTYQGSVNLRDVDGVTPEDMGLDRKHHTQQYRTYTIVKDGIYNIRWFPLSFSEKTHAILKAGGAIGVRSKWVKDKIYKVDLTRIPVINRDTAEQINIDDFVYTLEQEHQVSISRSVFNYFIKQNETQYQGYTEEQTAFLKANGVSKNGYNPPSVAVPSGDSYLSKQFNTKRLGMSKPSAKAVVKKLEDEKNLTPREQQAEDTVLIARNMDLDTLNRSINVMNNTLTETRTKIARTKFATIVGDTWFDGVERNGEYNGWQLKWEQKPISL